MKNKIALGALVFVAFIAIIVAVIAKDAENQRKTDEIIANTIKNGLEDDDGYSMDEISNAFSKEALESAGYKNLADIAYAKVENGILYLVYFDNDTESALYLAGMLMTELEGSHDLVITWEGSEYEISEEKADGNEETFWKLFPEDWHGTINEAMSGSGIQYLVNKGDADKIDEAVEEFVKSQDTNNGYEEKQESSQVESNIEVIDKFEWEYDENNNLTIGLTKDKESGILSISAFGHYEDGNIGLAQNDYIVIFAMSYSSGIDSSIICSVGEESYLMTMDGGKILMNTFPSEIVEDVPETYLDSAKQMMNSLEDFYVKNGLKEKTYNELVYEDENVKIFFTGISGKETEYKINFTIENLSDKTLTVQLRESSVNGVMARVVCSIDIAPGKKAIDGATVWGESAELTPMSAVKNFETKFHIFNDEEPKVSYDTESVIVFDTEE